MKIVGVVLILAGVAALVYQGFTYTKERDTVQLGPIGITAEQRETVAIPPIVGAGLVIVGAGLLFFARRKA